VARAPGRVQGREAGARRHLPGRDGRADAAARPLRRHDRRRIRRPGPLRVPVREDRGAGLGGLDVPDRDLQLSPDDGLAGGEVRFRRLEKTIPAEILCRRDSRRPGAYRAQCGHGPAGHPDEGGEERRSLRAERHQDLDLERHPWRLLRGARQDRPGGKPAPPRHEHVPVRERQGALGRQEAREARLQGHRLGRARVRGLQGAGGKPDRRRRGAGLPAGRRRARARPHQRRRARRGRRGRGACGGAEIGRAHV